MFPARPNDMNTSVMLKKSESELLSRQQCGLFSAISVDMEWICCYTSRGKKNGI